MGILFYILGLITAGSIAIAINFKKSNKKLLKENKNLSNENYNLANFKAKHEEKRGIIKRGFSRGVNSPTKQFILEVLEVDKTNTKSKIVIENISCLDADEKISDKDRKRIPKLVGEWVDSSIIDWTVDRTPDEIREDKINDILDDN